MKTNIFRFLLTLSLLAGAACSGKKVLDTSTRVTKAGVISIGADWIKDKGDKVDLSFSIKNEGDRSVVLFLSDINCYRGSTTGIMQYTFFNTGERVIDLRPFELKQANMVCRFQSKVEGDFKVSVRKVFENRSGDGRTGGKVLASDVIWTHKF